MKIEVAQQDGYLLSPFETTRVCMYVCMYVGTYMYVCMYVCMNDNVHVSRYVLRIYDQVRRPYVF
jgi:hypothetical protein